MKRALMGAINVFIDAGLGVTIEKVFHEVSDECEVNSWGAAWNRYQLAVSGWQLFFTFVEGAADNATFSIITACLQEATAYLLNPTSGASFNKGSPGFDPKVFFDKFIVGCVEHVAAGRLLDLGKHASKAIKKVHGEKLSPQLIARYELDVRKLAKYFFHVRSLGVRAWKGLSVAPTWARVNPDLLAKLVGQTVSFVALSRSYCGSW
jgi:hypothetical protein